MRTPTVLLPMAQLVGCTPTVDPTPKPTPNPTHTCSAEDRSATFPCTAEEWQAQKDRDAEYLEAEAVYREYRNASDAYAQGANSDRTSVSAFLAREALERFEETREDAGTDSDDSWTMAEGRTVIRRIDREVRLPKEGSDLALSVCEDTSAVTWRHTDGSEDTGTLVRRSAYFAHIDGAWRIVYSAFHRVSEC